MKATNLYGVDLFGDPINSAPTGPVAERFGFPPFSILDARSADWLERKRAWIATGIESEDGRSAKAYQIHDWMADRPEARGGVGLEGLKGDGTSIFDPVLCELMYMWFCPEKGQVVDPFAGGSVRGIVASKMGREYYGVELRGEQVAANVNQRAALCEGAGPEWVCGDAAEELEAAPESDLLFTCPPYGNLEVYSDDPRDLSGMEWHTFTAAYKRIIARAVKNMRRDSFACFVVGNFRDKKGFYRDLVGATVDGFEESGAGLYNEAVLATPIGTAAMRVTKQFESGRKMAKIHQNVLVFCKGDWKNASVKCGKETE